MFPAGPFNCNHSMSSTTFIFTQEQRGGRSSCLFPMGCLFLVSLLASYDRVAFLVRPSPRTIGVLVCDEKMHPNGDGRENLLKTSTPTARGAGTHRNQAPERKQTTATFTFLFLGRARSISYN